MIYRISIVQACIRQSIPIDAWVTGKPNLMNPLCNLSAQFASNLWKKSDRQEIASV